MSERRNLFRTQALMYKSVGEYGRSLIYQPLLLKLMTVILTLLFLAALLAISFTNYKTTVAVRGSLAPREGTIKVYANSPGRLENILVSEGQAVTTGMVLAVISNVQYDRQGLEKDRLLLAQMDAEHEFLREQLSMSKLLQSELESQQGASVIGLRKSIVLLEQELKLLNNQLQLSEDNLQAQAAVLELRGISRIQFNQHQAAHMGLLLQAQDLQLRIHGMRNQVEEKRAQRSNTSLEYRQEQLLIQSQIEQLEYRYLQFQSEQTETLLASADGVVTAITAMPGQNSNLQQPLMYINTAHASVEALLYVPSNAIGNIKLQQKVLIGYDAYSQQSYGSYTATIDSISQTSVDPRQHLFPIASLQEPVYLVKASLEQQHVSGPEMHQLKPGMLFTAEIVTDDLTILQHIFNPVTRLKRKT